MSNINKCGYASFLSDLHREKITLRQVRLQTEYTGQCEVLIKIVEARSPRNEYVKLVSYNNGITITVIDSNEAKLDVNTTYSLSYLKLLSPKEVNINIADYNSDILVNCYEYINFLNEHNIRFPYHDLIVISNVLEMENAYWNGSYFVIGNGITNSSRALTCPSIIAHELTHAITQNYLHLNYHGESGSLNESFSDIFGVMTEFYLVAKRANNIEWELGEEVFFDHHSMRSFRDPNELGHPKSVKDPLFYRGEFDNGGVHTNSSVINHLFYRMQLILDKKNIFDMFLKVYFKLKHNSDFNEFKRILLSYTYNNVDLIKVIDEIL